MSRILDEQASQKNQVHFTPADPDGPGWAIVAFATPEIAKARHGNRHHRKYSKYRNSINRDSLEDLSELELFAFYAWTPDRLFSGSIQALQNADSK